MNTRTFYIVLKDDWPVFVSTDTAAASRKKQELQEAADEKHRLYNRAGKPPYFHILTCEGQQDEPELAAIPTPAYQAQDRRKKTRDE